MRKRNEPLVMLGIMGKKLEVKMHMVLTDTTPSKYPRRALLRFMILCSESLVGTESTVISILRNAHMLSKDGFSDCKRKRLQV